VASRREHVTPLNACHPLVPIIRDPKILKKHKAEFSFPLHPSCLNVADLGFLWGPSVSWGYGLYCSIILEWTFALNLVLNPNYNFNGASCFF